MYLVSLYAAENLNISENLGSFFRKFLEARLDK